MSAAPVYRRAPHAAHYGERDRGHDLESWDVVLPRYNAPKPAGVPADADRAYGYVDRAGAQHVVFTRPASLTGPCTLERCPHMFAQDRASRG